MSVLESLVIEPTVYYTVDEAAHLRHLAADRFALLPVENRLNGIRIDDQWRGLGIALLDLAVPEQLGQAAFVADRLAASVPALKEDWVTKRTRSMTGCSRGDGDSGWHRLQRHGRIQRRPAVVVSETSSTPQASGSLWRPLQRLVAAISPRRYALR